MGNAIAGKMVTVIVLSLHGPGARVDVLDRTLCGNAPPVKRVIKSGEMFRHQPVTIGVPMDIARHKIFQVSGQRIGVGHERAFLILRKRFAKDFGTVAELIKWLEGN